MWVEIMLVSLAVIVSVITVLLVVKLVKKVYNRKTVDTSSSSKDICSVEIDKEEKIKQEILGVNKYVEICLKNKEVFDVLGAFFNTKFKNVLPDWFDYVFTPYEAWEILSKTEPISIIFRCDFLHEINGTMYTKALNNMNSIIIRKEEKEVWDDFLLGRSIKKAIISLIKNNTFDPETEYEKTIWQICGQTLKELIKFSNAITCGEMLMQDAEISAQEKCYLCFAICFIYYALEIRRYKDQKSIRKGNWLEIYIDKTEENDNKEFIVQIIEHIFKIETQIENEKFFLRDVLYFIFYVFAKYEKGLTLSKFKSQYAETILNETKKRLKKVKAKDYLETLKKQEDSCEKTYSIAQIDNMEGAEFEKFVAELFSRLGYVTQHTKLSGDQGVDVIAERNGKKIAIQAKHYNQPVGNHAIMEVVAGAKMYNANLCYVVTNNYFTKSAILLANANNVILWDREKLIEKISEV